MLNTEDKMSREIEKIKKLHSREKKLRITACESIQRCQQVWASLYDIVDKETEEALIGGYFDYIIEELESFKMFPLIDYFTIIKAQQEGIELKTNKAPEYIDKMIAFWQAKKKLI